MIQFAAREFYAPPRLRTNDQRLNRTALNSAEDMRDSFIDTSYGIFDATPIAAWQSTSGQYLTAIKLVNRKSSPVKVNPFHLNMQYSYAAAQHIQLNQNNVPGDTTMLYVISDRPFSDSRYESPAPWAPVASSQPAVNQYHRQGAINEWCNGRGKPNAQDWRWSGVSGRHRSWIRGLHRSRE